MDIISRKEAKKLKLKHYFTGEPCKKGHIVKRKTGNGQCMQCAKEWQQDNKEYFSKYYQENPDKAKERVRKWKQDNKDKVKEINRKYYQENSDKLKEINRKWQQENREYFSKWREENPDKVNAFNAKRRASKLQRTTAWANFEDIRMWYELAEVLSRSGIKFHVDHVVPLQGKTVSGLHVEDNLTVIPAYMNFSKNNQWNWEKQSHE